MYINVARVATALLCVCVSMRIQFSALVSSLTVDIESIFSTVGNDKVVALDDRPKNE